MELELSKAEIKANELLEEVEKDGKGRTIDTNQKLDIEKELNVSQKSDFNAFTNVIGTVIDKGVNYAIKALPIGDSLKDIALDIKEAIKTNDFKHIIKTAIGSSIREGLEIIGTPLNMIKDITKMKDIAFTGGLTKSLCAGVEIISSKYLKNNLFVSMSKDFVGIIKNFINSKDFVKKIDSSISKINNKVSSFKSICDTWREAYEKFDLDKINEVAGTLSRRLRGVSNSEECKEENNTIQNITKMVNNTRKKLTSIQLEACKAI